MPADWTQITPELQEALTRKALGRARHIIGAQAELLAEQIDRGAVPNLTGSDALRLLVMLLSQE